MGANSLIAILSGSQIPAMGMEQEVKWVNLVCWKHMSPLKTLIEADTLSYSLKSIFKIPGWRNVYTVQKVTL